MPGLLSVAGRLPAGRAAGLAIQVVSGHLPAHQVAITVGKMSYEVDGSLSDAVRPGGWREQGAIDDYALFVRTKAPNPAYAIAPVGQPAPPVTVVSNGANAESIRLRTSAPVVVVRDVAWDVGWHATDSANGGTPQSVRVERHGLVQQVRLPAGSDVVVFTYRPPHWLVASVLSAGSTALLLVLLALVVLRRTRRRRRVTAGPLPAPIAESALVLSSRDGPG
jgi:hypothetical protein